jgi:hypothetical protein
MIYRFSATDTVKASSGQHTWLPNNKPCARTSAIFAVYRLRFRELTTDTETAPSELADSNTSVFKQIDSPTSPLTSISNSLPRKVPTLDPFTWTGFFGALFLFLYIRPFLSALPVSLTGGSRLSITALPFRSLAFQPVNKTPAGQWDNNIYSPRALKQGSGIELHEGPID